MFVVEFGTHILVCYKKELIGEGFTSEGFFELRLVVLQSCLVDLNLLIKFQQLFIADGWKVVLVCQVQLKFSVFFED